MPREERGSLTSCQVRGRHTPPTQSQRSQDWNWGRGTVGLGLGDWTGALQICLGSRRIEAISEDLRHQGAGGGAGDFFLLQAKTCMVSHHHLRAARCHPLHHPVLLPPHPGRRVTGHHHLQHSARAATSGATWWRCPSGGCRRRSRVTRKRITSILM